MSATEKEFNKTENPKFQFLQLSLSSIFLTLQAADPFQGVALALKGIKAVIRTRKGANVVITCQK